MFVCEVEVPIAKEAQFDDEVRHSGSVRVEIRKGIFSARECNVNDQTPVVAGLDKLLQVIDERVAQFTRGVDDRKIGPKCVPGGEEAQPIKMAPLKSIEILPNEIAGCAKTSEIAESEQECREAVD